MGQKINPNLLRLGIVENWKSRWWPKRQFREQLEEDLCIRELLKKKAAQAGIIRIDIERAPDKGFKVFLTVARPGIVIGRGGKGIEELSKLVEGSLAALHRRRGVAHPKLSINLTVEELRRGDISAQYIAQSIAWDIEKRMRTRRVMKKYLDLIMQHKGVEGAKIKLSGRIDGNEISRREMLSRGKLPLQTLRAKVDYGEVPSFNTYGTVGVKVWIYKGEVFEK